MVSKYRELYNQNFSQAKYEKLKHFFDDNHPGSLGFRLSESPIFLSKEFGEKIKNVSESIIDQILKPEIFEDESKIPPNFKVPNQSARPHFFAIDFGICQNDNGELEPQLIELQGFPSLFCYQKKLADWTREVYDLPENLSLTPGNCFDEAKYHDFLQKVIVDDFEKENVVLLELYPKKQKTRIDFDITQEELGIEPICITEIKKEDKELYYIHEGVKWPIYRIYNRIIFDELNQFKDLDLEFNLTDDVNVEWCTHPDWFFKISKSILPQLQHEYIPNTFFANEFPAEENIADFVLKPLYSFAGKGVNLYPTLEDLKSIEKPSQWILQKKVAYAPVFEDIKGEKAKAEIRIMYAWAPSEERPQMLINLVRMTKSDKVNVEHLGQEQIWTGSSVAFFEV